MLPEESILNDKAAPASNLAPDMESPLIPDSDPVPDFLPAAVTEADVAGEQFAGTALNPIRPRTTQAMAAEQNQAALAALNGPATMDDLYRVWRQAAGMKPEEALTHLRQTAWGGVGLIALGVAALRDAESVSAYLADMAQGNEALKNMSPEPHGRSVEPGQRPGCQ